MGNKAPFAVEVAYAVRGEQVLLSLEVTPGTTVREAIAQCGIAQRFPHIDLAHGKVGIFGKLVKPDCVLRAGDRVEIYRPLIAGPKEARRQRARQGR
jgi:putative ubiquitin-RnfH superfamily antitoxin RatB of RatAB toxin-antitoxin module